MPLYRKDLASLLKSGDDVADNLARQDSQRLQSKLDIDKQKQQQLNDIGSLNAAIGDKDSPLAQYLQHGASIHLGNAGIGTDPNMAMLSKNIHGDAQARQHALDTYNKNVPKLQQAAQAASEGLSALDANDATSLGRVKTNMLSSLGMNRYNQQEANAILGPTGASGLSSIMTFLGENGQPINDVQKASAKKAFMDVLSGINDRHEVLKQNSLQSYQASPYANSAYATQLQTNLGDPFTKQLQGFKSKYPDAQPVQGSNAAKAIGGIATKPASSMLGGLRDLLLGQPQQQAAPQSATEPRQAPPPQPQAPNQSAVPVMPKSRSIVKVLQNTATGQKKIQYSDGTEEIQ